MSGGHLTIPQPSRDGVGLNFQVMSIPSGQHHFNVGVNIDLAERGEDLMKSH